MHFRYITCMSLRRFALSLIRTMSSAAHLKTSSDEAILCDLLSIISNCIVGFLKPTRDLMKIENYKGVLAKD